MHQISFCSRIVYTLEQKSFELLYFAYFCILLFSMHILYLFLITAPSV